MTGNINNKKVDSCICQTRTFTKNKFIRELQSRSSQMLHWSRLWTAPVGGRPQLTSRQPGFAVVLQAAQNSEVNKQISESEPAAICDVRCHRLSFRAGSSALPADVFYLKLFHTHTHTHWFSSKSVDTKLSSYWGLKLDFSSFCKA